MSAEAESCHFLIRPLAERDLDRVMEIELQAYPYPWTRGIFADCGSGLPFDACGDASSGGGCC